MNSNKDTRKADTIKRVILLILPHKIPAIANLLLALVNVACSLYVPILIGRAIDNIISEGNVELTIVAGILAKAAAYIVLGAVSQYMMSLISNRLSYVIVKDLRTEAFDHIWRLPLSYLDSHASGDIISRLIADADQFADGMLLGFTQLFSGVATILGTLIFMLYLNPYIALVVVFVTPLSFFVAKYITGHTYDLFKAQTKIRGMQTSQIEESLSQVKVIRAFGNEKEINEKFDNVNNELEKVSLMALFYSSLTNPCTRFVNSIVYVLVALTGAMSVIAGTMSVGIWSCFLNYANQYTKPFNEITGVITELQGAFACALRIFDFIDELEETSDVDLPDITAAMGNVNVENIDFSYDKNKQLIENFSLSVKEGQKVAIVGPTGCGKTTLINLLMRFYEPDSGRITVDGQDISKVTRDSLRGLYGMVLQDTWLRNASIADNIRIGKPNASIDEIIEAAKETHAHSFIRRLENGYDTVISEDGGSLSAGQKQLLCITRIMLMKPPMLILDEATSSIDTMTEARIQRAFYKLMDGRTSFIVAHRLSTIKGSDIILAMRDGKIVEMGNHNELMQKGGFYASLYNAGQGKV